MEGGFIDEVDAGEVSSPSEAEELTQAEKMRNHINALLQGIERYNPVNLDTLESYVLMQAQENFYDFEANSAILALYKFHPHKYNNEVTSLILLKALTNFPYTDFVMCKCQLTQQIMANAVISHIMFLGDLLEKCEFEEFWSRVYAAPELVTKIVGFKDSIRRFVSYVVGTTYERIEKNILAQMMGDVDDETLARVVESNDWNDSGDGMIYVAKQDELIKPKKVIEKIEFEAVSPIIGKFLQ